MLFLSVLPSVLSWLTLACSGLYPSWLFLSLSRALEEPFSQFVGFAVPDLPNACSCCGDGAEHSPALCSGISQL